MRTKREAATMPDKCMEGIHGCGSAARSTLPMPSVGSLCLKVPKTNQHTNNKDGAFLYDLPRNSKSPTAMGDLLDH